MDITKDTLRNIGGIALIIAGAVMPYSDRFLNALGGAMVFTGSCMILLWRK